MTICVQQKKRHTFFALRCYGQLLIAREVCPVGVPPKYHLPARLFSDKGCTFEKPSQIDIFYHHSPSQKNSGGLPRTNWKQNYIYIKGSLQKREPNAQIDQPSIRDSRHSTTKQENNGQLLLRRSRPALGRQRQFSWIHSLF